MGTAEEWYKGTQEEFEAGRKRFERFNDFLQTEAFHKCFQVGRERAAADLDGIWRAVGVEGVVYPEAIAHSRYKAAERNAHDDDVAIEIAKAALADDATEIGRIILNQLKHYLDDCAEDFVRDNWGKWV